MIKQTKQECPLPQSIRGAMDVAREPHEMLEQDQPAIKSIQTLHDLHIPRPPGETTGDPFPRLEEVEKIINYNFMNRRLLVEAFMHGSCTGSPSYEQLKYVGDSVLNLLISRETYFTYPDLQPGELTRLRAVNVGNEKLARAALKHGLQKYLRHDIFKFDCQQIVLQTMLESCPCKLLIANIDSSELNQFPRLQVRTREFMEAIADYPLDSCGLVDPPKVLADIVESIIGAIFIDNGSLDTTWKVVENLLEPIIAPTTMQQHPVTKLNEGT